MAGSVLFEPDEIFVRTDCIDDVIGHLEVHAFDPYPGKLDFMDISWLTNYIVWSSVGFSGLTVDEIRPRIASETTRMGSS